MADTTIDLLKNSSYVGKMDELIAAVKLGGSTASDVEWDNVKNKPTTIGGYGIIDAKIDNGTITLGNQTITPLTSAPVTSVNSKTGAVTLSASDVSAIPSTLTGTAGQVLTKTADGQEWKDVDIPTALPNPNALTFTGAVTGSYDGSAPLSVEIPSGGGGSDWELIAEITSDGTGTNSGLVAPISFNSYKELHMEATSIADSSITFRLLLSKTTNWYDGQVITSSASTNVVAHMAHFWIMDGYIKIISGHNSGYSDNQNNGTCKFTNSPRNAYLASDYDYIRFDANNSVVPEGATLKIWGVK